MNSVQLPDERLKRRLGVLVEQLSQSPDQSIGCACGSERDTKAAYRFLG